MTKAGIPKSINLPALLEQHPPKFKYDLDSFYYILGTLTKLRLQNKDNDDDLIPLNAQIMQRRIRLYNYYLKYLLHHEVVITDNQFIVEAKKIAFLLVSSTASGTGVYYR